MSGGTTTFRVKVNGGSPADLTVATSLYASAAAAVPATLGVEQFPVEVQIWVEDLQPDYPPLNFSILEAGGAALVFART